MMHILEIEDSPSWSRPLTSYNTDLYSVWILWGYTVRIYSSPSDRRREEVTLEELRFEGWKRFLQLITWAVGGMCPNVRSSFGSIDRGLQNSRERRRGSFHAIMDQLWLRTMSGKASTWLEGQPYNLRQIS
jgi:hypothetical protein